MNSIHEVLKNRRTVRKYLDKQIDDILLNNLLELSFRSSNTGNMQLYSVVVTRTQEVKQQLSPCHFNQPMITEAPVVLTFCADFNRFNKWCELNKAVPGYDNFLSFFTATIDTSIVAQTFCIAAEAMGLGICYLGTTNYFAKKIGEILKLPKFVVPITTITVGFPSDINSQTDRLPIQGIVHNEYYSDYSDHDIATIYYEKENLPEMRKFVSDNNKESLAQVFTDVRYTKKNNEAFSLMLLDYLKEQGFKL